MGLGPPVIHTPVSPTGVTRIGKGTASLAIGDIVNQAVNAQPDVTSPGMAPATAMVATSSDPNAAFPIPRLDGMRGLPVLSRIVRTEGTALIATYELALDDATVTALIAYLTSLK